MKHTQGKWTAKIHKRARVKYGVRKGEPCGLQQISIRTDVDTIKNHICDVIGYDNSGSSWTSRKEAKANANLIAAAPELLEALNYIVDECEKMKVDDHGANGIYDDTPIHQIRETLYRVLRLFNKKAKDVTTKAERI